MSTEVNLHNVKKDEYWKALQVIDTAHLRVHDGQAFTVSHIWPETGEIADNANADILIQVGANRLHAVWNLSCGGNSETYFYEGTTFSAAGTAITAYNQNRSSAKTSLSTFTHTPTVTLVGTELIAEFLPGGTKDAGSGGSGETFVREIDLAPSTDYLIRITNRSGAIQMASIHIEFYEDV